MECIGEQLVEYLTGLADFDEKKPPPFGLRYWLGWLGIFINLLMLALLVFVLVFSFIAFLKMKSQSAVLVTFFLLPSVLFWLWKTGSLIRKMWCLTRYYKPIDSEHQ